MRAASWLLVLTGAASAMVAGAAATASRAERAVWWAFQPVRRCEPPPVRQRAWVRNPIDAFVLARLEAKGLRPNRPATRRELIRRATYDLTGLLPTPEEVEAFVRDPAPDAYERLIDRLLASPHYGERWARHWLDLARFAESEGFKADETRPEAWRYRDYVIAAFNQDKPYDRFILEQLAGDELAPDDPEALVATAFNRHWADESNARNIRLRRQEILNDITDTTSAVFLGVTLQCARCHDHKYDPFSQKDYYAFQAFFAAVRPRDDLPLVPRAEVARYQEQLRAWEERTRSVRDRMEAIATPHRERLFRGKLAVFPPEVQEAVQTPPAERTALQALLAAKVAPQVEVKTEEIVKAMSEAERTEWNALQKELDAHAALKPPPLPVGLGITDIGPVAPPTHRLAVGLYNTPLEEVAPAFPAILATAPPRIVGTPTSTGRRLALARWIASPRNPLTARVMVNRVWQYHFGAGLLRTPSDFGRQGERPTHPELLDWLASEFVRGAGGSGKPWSLKALHRLIMTSNTYRQAAAYDPRAARLDPENRLLWRFPRRRMEGEAIRDAILQVSGLLNPKRGGPSVFPELPEGVETRGGWPVSHDPAERHRRSVYVFVRRNLRYPLFEAFDFPDTHESCARRNTTVSAPQAMILLNDRVVLEAAQAFAGRLLREAGSDPAAQIERAYRLAYGRRPGADEQQLAQEFLARQAALIGERLARGERVLLPAGMPEGADPARGAALVDFCHALFNTNEFLTIE